MVVKGFINVIVNGNYMVRKLFLLFVLILLVGCSGGSYVEVDGTRFKVEIADSAAERADGLMFREELCSDCGMLFVFEGDGVKGFWMKNTLIPLDMVFIGADLRIIDVLHAEPCVEDPCESYVSSGLYVLEVNSGTFSSDDVGKLVVIE